MTDHYDAAIVRMRQSLAEANKRAIGGDFMAEHEAEVMAQALADLEREAAAWRALTPEQKAALEAEREAKAEAFEAGLATCPGDEDEDDDNSDDYEGED